MVQLAIDSIHKENVTRPLTQAVLTKIIRPLMQTALTKSFAPENETDSLVGREFT
jgi:hypothetical protein